MIAVDTNVVVYAHRSDSPFHEAARRCIDGLAAAGAPWALPWPCVHEFIAVVTHPRIYKRPTPLADAFNTVRALIDGGGAVTIGEAPGYLPRLAQLAAAARVAGPAVHDARIAAICLNHGVRELWSADRDFSRYGALVVRNPLAGG